MKGFDPQPLKFWGRAPIQCWSTGLGWTMYFVSLVPMSIQIGKKFACTGKQQPRKVDLSCLYTVRSFGEALQGTEETC